MGIANVRVTGIWSGNASANRNQQTLELVTVRQTQEKIFFGVIEESEGDYAYKVLVDGKQSTLNEICGTGANADDVARESQQDFWFYLPKDARRTVGPHDVDILIGYVKDEEFVETNQYPFEVIVTVPEEE